MNQYKRGIQAYKSVSTGSLIKSEPLETPKIDNTITPVKGLIKTTKPENKYTKVAKLLLILGTDEASKVISHLPPDEIEKVSMEITKIDRVGKSEAYLLLKEFGKDSSAFNRNQGGVETARSILVSAFGQDKGNQLLYKAVPDSADKPFAFLNDLDFNQRMMVLRKESISVLTIVLHHLSPKFSSPIMEALPPEQQKEIILRLTKLKQISPQVIGIISESLTDKIKKMGNTDSIELDGRGALADILKHMDRGSEENILQHIQETDPNLGDVIRDRLYTIDIICNIEPIDFQKIIQEISDQDLVFLIKGESKDIQGRIWGAMSEGRRLLVQAEMDITGLVKKSDADRMTKEFINLIKNKEEAGELRIISDDDWIY